jgi:hypothetical protein
MALIDITNQETTRRNAQGRPKAQGEPARPPGSGPMSQRELNMLWETCYQVAAQYVGLFIMTRNPYRLVKLNKKSIDLTKRLIAALFLRTAGEAAMIARVSSNLNVALHVLKHQKTIFTLDEIVGVAHAYTMGKTEAMV